MKTQMKNKFFVKKSECPYCLHKVDSAMDENGKPMLPNQGDITLCIKCGEVSEFNEKMDLIKFNVSQLDLEKLKDIRYKQYTIAFIHCREKQMQ